MPFLTVLVQCRWYISSCPPTWATLPICWLCSVFGQPKLHHPNRLNVILCLNLLERGKTWSSPECEKGAVYFGSYGSSDDHKKEENLIFSLDHSLSLDFLNRIFGVCLTPPFFRCGYTHGLVFVYTCMWIHMTEHMQSRVWCWVLSDSVILHIIFWDRLAYWTCSLQIC